MKIEDDLDRAKINNDSRGRTEQEGLLEQHLVKRKNLDNDETNIMKVIDDGASSEDKESRVNLWPLPNL